VRRQVSSGAVGDEPGKGIARDASLGANAAELSKELSRLRAVAQEASGPLGFVIANLGFALEEIAALTVELSPQAGAGDDLLARVARAQSALSTVGDALREARQGADHVRLIARDLAGRPPENRSTASHEYGAGAEGAASAQTPARSASTPRGRVLVVDDEPMIVRAIQRLLEGEHEVCLSTDPVDVVRQVRTGQRFDVILCDLMMPMMSGIDVYNAIRQVDSDQARRMVFMTGGAFTPRVLEFLDATENARIEKPLERATLRAAIRAQLLS
jgi:CheY-like chemotaxis protein